MIGIITDDNNDIVLDDVGNIRMESGAEALRQQLVNRILLQTREYQYDTNRGVDYSNYIFTDTPMPKLWEAEVFEIIDSIPEILSVIEWQYGVNENNFEFYLVVDSIYGTIEIKG